MPTTQPNGRKNPKSTPITISAIAIPIIAAAFPDAVRWKRSALDDDETLFRHLAHRPGRTLLRVARSLDSAVRHLVAAEGRRLVDEHSAELEPVGRAEGCVDGCREDARLKSEARTVRALDRLVHRSGFVDDHDRAEDLLAAHLLVVADTGDPRRLEELAGLATGEHFRSARSRLLDPRADPASRVVVDHGADVSLVVARVPDLQRFDLRHERLHEGVECGTLDVDALHGDAALPGERKRVCGELRRRRGNVGIRSDDHRRGVAELELDALAR